MPNINVKLVQGAYSVEERQQLITKFTDAVREAIAAGNDAAKGGSDG